MLVFTIVFFSFQSARAQTYTILYSFGDFAGGGDHPYVGLTQDSAGNLYGTAGGGDYHAAGTVFKLDTIGNYTVLYTFTGGADGKYPQSVFLDSAGNLYGTTNAGGLYGWGTVFKLNTRTGKEHVLFSFNGGVDGGWPYPTIIRGPGGNLYGTTQYPEVVFKVDKAGSETVLYSFTGGVDGGLPYAGLTHDSAGNLYGTTKYGGAYGLGTVFKVDTAGKETVLHSFGGSPADGAQPIAGLIRDTAGNLYGTTLVGGYYGMGTIFKLDTSGNETVLYSFSWADGVEPHAGLTHDSAGNLYGTTDRGGDLNYCYGQGCGTVFELDTNGKYSVLHTFTGADGWRAWGGLIRDSGGNLYGTTNGGGPYDEGVIFKISFP
jgi:uncharacterized repeat protein (TIGR03803 family)